MKTLDELYKMLEDKSPGTPLSFGRVKEHSAVITPKFLLAIAERQEEIIRLLTSIAFLLERKE